MISLIRTTSEHPDFVELVKLLDAYLAIIDGAEHSFYAQFNKIDMLKNVVVAFENGEAVGCGAFKPFESDKVEMKRMFVKEKMRGKKIAYQVLNELEQWAAALGFHHYVLETGIRQSAAISLYHKAGYQIIPNYGQYIGVENSVCFGKKLI
ncbi:GNAT family N-acetyltransferase [Pedobacter sp. Du54]|uniref:GNAT family N-acetyltransferase n=1 Tax=Pedobacter anseongensis TaxID=3133439 RepID=UPI0030B44ACB